MKFYIELFQLLASMATVAGIAFASLTFWKQQRETKVKFSREQADKFKACMNPIMISSIVDFLKEDNDLTKPQFEKIFWSEKRADLREVLDTADGIVALIEAGEIDLKTIGTRNIFRSILMLNQKTEMYRKMAYEVHDIQGFEEEFSSSQKQLEIWSKKFDRNTSHNKKRISAK